jgi:hypothetical protein
VLKGRGLMGVVVQRVVGRRAARRAEEEKRKVVQDGIVVRVRYLHIQACGLFGWKQFLL